MSVATARGLLDWRAASGWVPGAAVDHEALAQAISGRYLAWHRSGEWQGRAPGTACMTALSGGHAVDSKGCGGSCASRRWVRRPRRRRLRGRRAGGGADHRHRTSDAAAGFQALLVERLVGGDELGAAVAAARDALVAWRGLAEARAAGPGPAGAPDAPARPGAALDALEAAVRLAGDASVETYEALGRIGDVGIETPDGGGKGWVAEEALGIGLFCALRYRSDVAAALRAAALISGDSDSTASIAGAILGAAGGLGVDSGGLARGGRGSRRTVGLGRRAGVPTDRLTAPVRRPRSCYDRAGLVVSTRGTVMKGSVSRRRHMPVGRVVCALATALAIAAGLAAVCLATAPRAAAATTYWPLLRFGVEGSLPGQFELASPDGIAVDAVGNIYCTDPGNGRVEKFTSAGKFVCLIGDTDGLDDPYGLAVAANGTVYVMDTYKNRVREYTPSAGNGVCGRRRLVSAGSQWDVRARHLYRHGQPVPRVCGRRTEQRGVGVRQRQQRRRHPVVHHRRRPGQRHVAVQRP